MNKILNKRGGIIAGLLTASLMVSACGSGSGEPAPVRGDVVLSEFYVPGELPDAPGVLLRQEALSEGQTLAKATRNIRLLYSSTEGLRAKDINAVSGALYIPEGTAPEGGWPLLIWSHGTVGIGDVCAPSYNGRSERDRTYLTPWLEAGFAIAASDYQGLGTPGTHPYMDSRTMAHNNLDLVRALQSGGFPLSQKVVMAGQSQGASGVIASAGLTKTYAPDVELAGIMATGIPYFSRQVVMGLRKNSNPDAVDASLVLSLYMLALTEQIDPGFKLDDVISQEAWPIVSKIGEACVFDFIGETTKAGLSPNKTFSGSTTFKLLAATKRMQFPKLDLDVPVFTGTGTGDKITPYGMQQAFIDDACEAGSTLSIHTYEGANHNQGLLQSTDNAMAFALAVMVGKNIPNSCPEK